MHPDTERQHPLSPRGPELRDPGAFLHAVREGLPADHEAFTSGLSAQLVLDIDATGQVTSARADDSTDPAVARAVLAAVRTIGFLPAQHASEARAVQDHRVTLAMRAAALRLRDDGSGPPCKLP